MKGLKDLDSTALLFKAMEQESLLKECAELVWNVDFYHLDGLTHISQKSQSLLLKIGETLK